MNKIRTTEPRVIWNIKCKLGEGTLWVKEHNSIYFVDIKKKKICILNIKNNKKKQIKVNKEVGFLAHVKKNIFIFPPPLIQLFSRLNRGVVIVFFSIFSVYYGIAAIIAAIATLYSPYCICALLYLIIITIAPSTSFFLLDKQKHIYIYLLYSFLVFDMIFDVGPLFLYKRSSRAIIRCWDLGRSIDLD